MVTEHFGLSGCMVQQIQQVLAAYPSIEQVLLYGSRAMGKEKYGSDIDLVIVGADFSHQQLLHLLTALDDLLLPYSFDISRLDDIANPELHAHIQRVGQVFYQR
ncbi:nucleotidyltransferase domain-containing protein [Rheinheimera riviphila]|uniref:Nucleotidyltransferase domain-containing protein n=1 Tax=Rheinheimera riviphila TaxID=1834037 RepID=A0A437QIQ2_9GAMM|nr:nucleotidyltransferase domain-containing protein [Rheinheimera riviphila]RVU34405.1 nucleotidyltransferase domain-containing protein [Rheinheimera riviphila]